MSFSVLKFGGTSVANPESWPLIARLCTNKLAKGKHPVLVLSALSGVSNLLERLVNNAAETALFTNLSSRFDTPDKADSTRSIRTLQKKRV